MTDWVGRAYVAAMLVLTVAFIVCMYFLITADATTTITLTGCPRV